MKGHEPRSSSSCAACKFLKRRCTPTCIFAPYFRSDEPKKFAKVHKVFGASNVSKILIEVPEEQREDTVNSLAYEAEARLRDPVYGCIGAIALLQRRMVELQHDLAIARARLARYHHTSGTCTATTASALAGPAAAAGGSASLPVGLNGDCSNVLPLLNHGHLPFCDGFGVGGSELSQHGGFGDFGQPHFPL